MIDEDIMDCYGFSENYVPKQTRRQEMEDELDRFKAWRIKHCEFDEITAHKEWVNDLIVKKWVKK
jgi:hypothetical protein